MKVKVVERRIITQVEWATFEFELPSDVAKMAEEDRDEWIRDNYYEYDAEYELGDITDIFTDEVEVEIE